MIWAAAAALAFADAYLAFPKRGWMSLFGALLALLAADDALTLHEDGPHRVIPEPVFYLAYAIIATAIVAALLKRSFDDRTVIVLAGGAFLAASVCVDQAIEHQYIYEDSLKLIGALLWLVVPLIGLKELRTAQFHTARSHETERTRA